MADPARPARSGLGPWCVGVRVVVRRVLPGRSGASGGPLLTDLLGVLEEWAETTVTVRTEDGTAVVVSRADIVAGKPVPPRPSPRLRVPVVDAELRAMDTWPPLETQRLGDWVLRASAGFSTRGNSALLLGDPGCTWPEALDRLGAFYAARGLPLLVQAVCGSTELDRLHDADWVSARASEAAVTFRLAGLSRARRAARRLAPADPPEVAVTGTVTDAWLAEDTRARAHLPAALSVLQGPEQVGFAAVTSPAGEVVAKGRAALSERSEVWLGLTDLWVSPGARRQGLAATVIEALLGWGAERGATTVFLQTPADNAAALALYDRLGFEEHHAYRYLRPPAGQTQTTVSEGV